MKMEDREKKLYQKPCLEVILLENSDVITLSGKPKPDDWEGDIVRVFTGDDGT